MRTRAPKGLAIALHGVAVWGLCGGVMEAARAAIGQDNALVVHAVAAPIVAAAVSASYVRWFGYARPAATAGVFTVIPMVLDATVIAPFAEHSYLMFTSALGTWIPFALIFASAYATTALIGGQRTEAGGETA